MAPGSRKRDTVVRKATNKYHHSHVTYGHGLSFMSHKGEGSFCTLGGPCMNMCDHV